MATSGTIGATQITTGKLLEKAIRRCGLTPQVLAPEHVDTATEDMFMFLTSLASRGLNLWCIERDLMPVVQGCRIYVLPPGTLEILNMNFCTPYRGDYSLVNSPASVTANVTAGTLRVSRVGVKFSVLPTEPLDFQVSPDGVSWTTVQTVPVFDLPKVNQYLWFDPVIMPEGAVFRLSAATNIGTVTDFYLANMVREVPMSPFNRDEYASLPNKTNTGDQAYNFWFEKKIEPQFNPWPVILDDTRHFQVFYHRQIQDIGTLTQELEIPDRWFEAVCWHLALRLAYELPGVDPARLQMVMAMANSMTIEVENSENDNAPFFAAPNISVYTR